MKALKRNMFFIFVTVLAVFTSLTILQIYYNAYVHLFIFGCCLIFANKRYKFALPLALGGFVCFLFMFLSIGRTAVTPMSELGYYLHYVTWPIVLIASVNSLNNKQKLIIMRLMLVVGIVGSILSLRVLFADSSVSRILAGAASEAETYTYFSQGVGGYGTVYATAFLCFGAIYWFINTKSKADRVLIAVYLITAYVFIIYASYTIAIMITFILSLLALTSKVKPMVKSLIIIAVIALLLLLFWNNIIEFTIDIMRDLKLDKVVQRLTQLTQATETNTVTSLTRPQLYLKSFTSFLEHPLAGSEVAGRHSQILDTLAYFGISGFLMPALLIYYAYKTVKLSSARLILFYLVFFAFLLVNAGSTMQIPVSVFFLCPLIVNTVKKQNPKMKKPDKQSVTGDSK